MVNRRQRDSGHMPTRQAELGINQGPEGETEVQRAERIRNEYDDFVKKRRTKTRLRFRTKEQIEKEIKNIETEKRLRRVILPQQKEEQEEALFSPWRDRCITQGAWAGVRGFKH